MVLASLLNVLLTVQGNDKQLVGSVAAKIRSFRKPELYKAKALGINEHIKLSKVRQLVNNGIINNNIRRRSRRRNRSKSTSMFHDKYLG